MAELRFLPEGASDRDDRGGAAVAALRLLELAAELVRAFDTHAQARFGLSRGRLAVLLLLDGTGAAGLRPSELAERAGVSRATITALLDGLGAEGLVARTRDVRDRRSLRAVLTPAGRARLRAIAPANAARLAALTRTLTREERETLAALLEKLRAGLGALRGA